MTTNKFVLSVFSCNNSKIVLLYFISYIIFFSCKNDENTPIEDVFKLGFHEIYEEADSKVLLSGNVYPNPGLVFLYLDESIEKVMIHVDIDSLQNCEINRLTLYKSGESIFLNNLEMKAYNEDLSAFINTLKFRIKIAPFVPSYREIRSKTMLYFSRELFLETYNNNVHDTITALNPSWYHVYYGDSSFLHLTMSPNKKHEVPKWVKKDTIP